MIILKILLFPFSIIYGSIVWFWQQLYKWEVLQRFEFDIPVISIGNLSVGGTGKSPMVEYLIRLIEGKYKIATLSRGYGRKTGGYVFADEHSTAKDIGDEPAQFKSKFPEVAVGVCANRSLGIPNLVGDAPETQVVLMDDAFQSLSVKPGLSILLTEYAHLFSSDFLLPSGRLREFRSGYKRADIIIITKCPPSISENRKNFIKTKIQPLTHQQIYFSALKYGNLYRFQQHENNFSIAKDYDVVLFCGIANADLLIGYLEEKFNSVREIEFSDHHHYNIFDLHKMRTVFEKIKSSKKIIITTEKDAVRLKEFTDWIADNQLPLYCLPVETDFIGDEGREFDNFILNYLNGRYQ